MPPPRDLLGGYLVSVFAGHELARFARYKVCGLVSPYFRPDNK
jgi:hypothetical protein